MKKLLLLSAFALSFTLFSCTADDNDPQPVNKTVKITTPVQAEIPADGPGDGEPKSPPPPPTKP